MKLTIKCKDLAIDRDYEINTANMDRVYDFAREEGGLKESKDSWYREYILESIDDMLDSL